RCGGHLPVWHGAHLGLVVAEPEAKRALEDVGQLLVLVLVARDDRALVEVDVGDHHALGAEEPSLDAFLERLARHVVPPVERGGAVHGSPPVAPAIVSHASPSSPVEPTYARRVSATAA